MSNHFGRPHSRFRLPLLASCLVVLPHGACESDPSAQATPPSVQQEPAIGLLFSTFLGTQGAVFESLREIAFDSDGNILVVGMGDFSPTGYPDVPVTVFGTVDRSSIIVAKLAADGSQLLWVTLLGGQLAEKGGYGIAVDGEDNVYVAGTTHSPDFPTTSGAFDTTANNVSRESSDAFLFKLSPDGRRLVYSTYLGGSLQESARGGLAVDGQGYAYVVGSTQSLEDFLDRSSSGNPPNYVSRPAGGLTDGFVTKVSPRGDSIVYTRFLGGSDNPEPGRVDQVLGVRIDAAGHAYVAALISASDAPTTNDSRHNGLGDVYVAKLSPDGKDLLYGTYFGGDDFDGPAKRLWLGDDGSVYVVGATYSRNLPVPKAHQPQFGGGVVDAILAKFDPAGRLVSSTYIGGTLEDDAWGPSVDAAGNILVVGRTQSPDFEVTGTALDASHNGDSDVFLQAYSPQGDLLYSTFFGGQGFEDGRFLALDPSGRAVVVGTTRSGDFPTTSGAYDRTHNGGSDVFVAKFELRIAGQP